MTLLLLAVMLAVMRLIVAQFAFFIPKRGSQDDPIIVQVSKDPHLLVCMATVPAVCQEIVRQHMLPAIFTSLHARLDHQLHVCYPSRYCLDKQAYLWPAGESAMYPVMLSV